MKWQKTREYQKIDWNGIIPEKVIAIAHTHPQIANPKPSVEDATVAARLKIPVYTISRKGIWKVTRDGKITQESGRFWYKEVEENPCKESDQKL